MVPTHAANVISKISICLHGVYFEFDNLVVFDVAVKRRTVDLVDLL